jgi:hypothetical protein
VEGGGGGKRTNENAPSPRNITFFMERLLHKLDAKAEGDYTIRMQKESGRNCDEFYFLTVTSDK